MNDVSLVALATRTIVSLLVVLAVVGVAYRIAKRRAGGAAAGGRSSAGRQGSLFGGRRTAPAPVEVVGRVGLTRNSAAVAVRFGDRIVLVSAGDQAPSTLLAEMTGDEWDQLTEQPEVSSPIAAPVNGTGSSSSTVTAARPGFIEALRQATSRHE